MHIENRTKLMNKDDSLVSIIIPTYNRAHLIRETLDSVLMQTYRNWECIIIDDGSTDNTEQIVDEYCKKDKRFQYHSRPKNKLKGANSCRNYGFELSKGKYLNWFDSDDIMNETFIKKKMEVLENKKLDFVISNSINFDDQGNESPVFKNKNNANKKIAADNYVCNIINWITMDAMVRKESIEPLRFNEVLKSGQEYNFFCKYLFQNNNGVFLNEDLSRRRIHTNSIQQVQNKNRNIYLLNKYLVYLKTLLEVYKKADKKSINFLLRMSMSRAFDLSLINKKKPIFKDLIYQIFLHKGGFKLFIFLLSIVIAKMFKKGYRIMNYSTT